MNKQNAGPEVSTDAIKEILEMPGVTVGRDGRLLIQWEGEEK
jgi:hypothetical protein